MALNPRAQEQEMLELVNPMRLNPAAAYHLLVNAGDPDVNSAISYFNVNLSVLAASGGRGSPRSPLPGMKAYTKQPAPTANG